MRRHVAIAVATAGHLCARAALVLAHLAHRLVPAVEATREPREAQDEPNEYGEEDLPSVSVFVVRVPRHVDVHPNDVQ